MNREQFTQLINQPGTNSESFLAYFISRLFDMQAHYESLNKRIGGDNNVFNATGVEEALNQYFWPGSVANLTVPQVGPDSFETGDWASTRKALNQLRTLLQHNIKTRNNERALAVCIAIIDWGMGSGARGNAARNHLRNQADLTGYLAQVRALSDSDHDTVPITRHNVTNYNSGLSKVHALASQSGLIIYDSRVAFALGECVNQWLLNNQANAIPAHLKFMQGKRRNITSADPVFPRGWPQLNHGVNYRNKWLETQKRASWLFEAALTDEAGQGIWRGQPLPERMHQLEAAFFMFGAYAGILELP